MGNPKAFLTIHRKEAGYRPLDERVHDFSEVEQTLNTHDRREQASRCMDCGVPFCHWACPLGNKCPEWNDALYRGKWELAYKILTSTNPFPYEIRRQLLRNLFGDAVEIYPLPDIGVGNTAAWGDYVLENVMQRFGRMPDLLVSGKETRRLDWFDSVAGVRIAELYIPKTVEISASSWSWMTGNLGNVMLTLKCTPYTRNSVPWSWPPRGRKIR